MLRSRDVIGLTVVTEDTGEEVGTVKDVIIHRIKKSVVGFLVRRPGWFQHLCILPFAEALWFDESIVVAQSKASLYSFDKAPDAVRLLERRPLPGTTLITTEGHELGIISDFSFDEETGELKSIDVIIKSDGDEEVSSIPVPLDDGFFIGKDDAMLSNGLVHRSMTDTKEFACIESPTATPSQLESPASIIKEPGVILPFAAMPVPAAVPPDQTPPPEAFQITNEGSSLTIRFDDSANLDDLCIARLRDQLLRILAMNPLCSTLRFDVTNLKLLPSVMLGLLASLKKHVNSLEVLNPTKDAHEVIKMLGFDKLVKVRSFPG